MLCYTTCAEMHAVASINMNGVVGNISFRQSSLSSAVSIKIDLHGAGLDARGITWHVHEYPLDYSTLPAQQCMAESVGGHYDPYRKAGLSQYAMRCARNAADCETGDLSGRHGELTLGAAYEDRFLQLRGKESIVGRSLVLHRPDGSRWVCATILPASPAGGNNMLTAVARFTGPVIGGTITIRQPAGDPKADSTVLVDLYRTDGAVVDPLPYVWGLHTRPVIVANDTLHTDVSIRCQSAGSRYDPLDARQNVNYVRDCNNRQPENCAFGDLSSKHGRLSVPSSGHLRAFYTDSFLPLSGPYHVVGRPLLISDGVGDSQRIACSDLLTLESREMSATFDMQGVKGVMVFSQQSPWDPTWVTLDLSGLAGQAAGYHVHEFPRSVLGTVQYGSACSAQEVGGHWNPFRAPFPVTVPPGFASTPDLYEVGDLSGKHGSLANLQSVQQEMYDGQLPLFGPHSIAGRSIVIHRNAPNAPRWVCANIEMPQTAKRIAVAHFYAPLAGTIYFRQIDAFETSVFVDLARTDGGPSSAGHHWHIHANPIGNDRFPSVAQRCQSASGHYNPFNVSVAQLTYNCNAHDQMRCELGDASGKSSPLDFMATGSNRFVYTDVFLPLQGRFSVLGRSVVVHTANAGAPRLACATIEPYADRNAQASFGRAGVSGFVSFRQGSPFSSTVVTVQLSGLRGRASHYALHYLPSAEQASSAVAMASPPVTTPQESCSLTTIGQVYNPMGARFDSTVAANTASSASNDNSKTFSADTVAIGQLSWKFGSLERLTGVVSSFADTHYLPMSGPLNFVGRSVSLHDRQADTPWVCSNVNYLGGRLVTAVAKFTGHLQGEVRFEQVDNLPTQITIRLQHALQAIATASHQWTINVMPVGTDAMAVGNQRCMSAGPVHNPANVSVTDRLYLRRCSSLSATCQQGDLWYKHGMLRLAGSQQQSSLRVLLTEEFAPLSGPFSVIGRSVVIMSQEMGAERIACATIQQQ
eukprot:scpid32648/ scgid2310/ Superoxide dismutase [Cu-Zn]